MRRVMNCFSRGASFAIHFERLVDGLIAFRQEYSGKLWPEVMLVRGLNDTEEALRDIAAVLRRVQPDAVHINIPTRPVGGQWARPSGATLRGTLLERSPLALPR